MTDPKSKISHPRGSTFPGSASSAAAAADSEQAPRSASLASRARTNLQRLLPPRHAAPSYTQPASTARTAMAKLRVFFEHKARDIGRNSQPDSQASSTARVDSVFQSSTANSLKDPCSQASSSHTLMLHECQEQEGIECDGCVIPDAALRPEATAIARKVFDDAEIRRLMQRPREKCMLAAHRVRKLLQSEEIDHHARSLLMWKSATDEAPMTHLVMVATIDGRKYVIDPTAAQFGDCPPMFVSDEEWQQRLRKACSTKAMFYGDYADIADASMYAGVFFRGHVLSYEEGTLMNAPSWYERVHRNPDSFADLVRKTGMFG